MLRPCQRVWFLGLFGLKTSIRFAHCGLESGMVFEGTTRVCERFQMNNKEVEICEFEMHLKNFFVCALI